ncbi:MAG: hypothetical protein EOP84_21460 [Verrucomicrobiaceae bacterium]|nr:MAG: hypothetical protein EOP84_21460 [Verrucomicrobiaceae bacterium]
MIFLPVAFLATFLIVPLHWILVQVLTLVHEVIYISDTSFKVISTMFVALVSPWAFVWAGATVAPSYKMRVGFVLAALEVVMWIYERAVMGWPLQPLVLTMHSLGVILSLLGVFGGEIARAMREGEAENKGKLAAIANWRPEEPD